MYQRTYSIPTFARNEANEIGDIQEELMSLDEFTIGGFEETIADSIFNQSNSRAKQLYGLIIGAIKYRPLEIPVYSQLCCKLATFLPNFNSNDMLNECILSFATNSTDSSDITIIAFLYVAFKDHFFNFQEIYNSMKLFHDKLAEIKNPYGYFIAWFLPELYLLEGDAVYKEIEQLGGYFSDIFPKDKNIEEIIQIIQEDREQKRLSLFRQIFIDDNVNELIEIASSVEFDFNQVIPSDIYEPCWIINNKPKLIQYAAYFGAIRCFKFLLLSDATLQEKSISNSRSVDFYAVASNSIEILRIMDQNNCTFYHAYWWSIIFFRPEILEWLINCKGFALNEKFLNQGNCIHAAATSNNVKIALKFIDQGGDPNSVNGRSQTALHVAAQTGSLDIIKLLISIPGIDVNKKAIYDLTPLHLAISSYQISIIEMLLDVESLDINIKDNDGLTPLNFSVKFNDSYLVSLLLKRNEIDVNTRSENFFSPLHRAAKLNAFNVMKTLMSHPNVDVNSSSLSNMLPIHSAADAGSLECLKLLVQRNDVDINQPTKYGRTPLHFAVIANRIEVVKYLVSLPNVSVNYIDTLLFNSLKELNLLLLCSITLCMF